MTPALSELVAVDRTGEPNWPYGAEDVAGDGLDTFATAEQSVDLRSAYAETDMTRLWLRSYVSAQGEPDASLRLYVFIDADDDDTTGGSAEASEVDADFGPDPTAGGYDHIVGIGGDESILGVWSHSAAQDMFMESAPAAATAQVEVGVDRDPLRFASVQRGYLQGSVDLSDVDVTAACNANLFFRALSDEGNDADVGARSRCIAADGNGNGVPDVVEVSDCNSNDDCPAGAVCLAGECRYTPSCADDGDCDTGESCIDGLCVADGGQDCDTSADCDGLVCVSGSCEPCTSAGADCASGQTCGSDGRCVAGTPGGGQGGAAALVDPDEEVQGGACTCRIGQHTTNLPWGLALGLALLTLGRRRTR